MPRARTKKPGPGVLPESALQEDTFESSASSPLTIAELQPLIGVVVVNESCRERVQTTLTSLASSSYKNFITIVVDDCSADGSGFELERIHSKEGVFVLLSPERRGSAVARNLGIRFAEIRCAQYVWMLSAGVECGLECLSTLVKYMITRPEAGAVSGKLLFADDTALAPRIYGAGAELDAGRNLKKIGEMQLDHGQFEDVRECGVLPPESILFRISVLDRAGYFSERFSHSYEREEWCVRVRRSGYKLCYVPGSASRVHISEAGTFAVFDSDRLRESERDRLLFYFSLLDSGQKLAFLMKILFRMVPAILNETFGAETAEEKRLSQAKLLGISDFLFLRPVPRKRRTEIPAVLPLEPV
jgi:GT2 family glycosyltransferase